MGLQPENAGRDCLRCDDEDATSYQNEPWARPSETAGASALGKQFD